MMQQHARYTTTKPVSIRILLHAIIICVVIPLLQIIGSSASHISLLLVFPAFIIFYSGWRLAEIAAHGVNRVVEITFWMYVYYFFWCVFILATGTRPLSMARKLFDSACC